MFKGEGSAERAVGPAGEEAALQDALHGGRDGVSLVRERQWRP